jgi:hypothetical protein
MAGLAATVLVLGCVLAADGGDAGRVLAAGPSFAVNASNLKLGMNLERLSPTASDDSARVIARWGASGNSLGNADAYWVEFTTDKGFRRERKVVGLADTAVIALPMPPDSVRVTVTVVAERRGQLSQPVTASRYFKRSDAAPPPPGPVVIDTVTVVHYDITPHDQTWQPLVMQVGQVTGVCVFYGTPSGRFGPGELTADLTKVDQVFADYMASADVCRAIGEARHPGKFDLVARYVGLVSSDTSVAKVTPTVRVP